MSKIKNFKFLTLSVVILALLVVAINPGISPVKAQNQASLYVYTSVGGTISSEGTNLTGGSTYNYTSGQAVTFTANPDPGCSFLFWAYASPSGVNTSTANPFVYNISSTECAIQAMFIPDYNITQAPTTSQTGTVPFEVPISLGGTTTPAAGTYNNYSIGQVVSFTATPGNGFKFMYWLVPAATGGAVSIVTSPNLDFNVTANACAIQAFFAPTNSDITLPEIPIDEFSSAAAIMLVALLAIVALGAYTYRKTKLTKM